jgi:DNA-binding NtrC family response regulator
MRPLIELLGTFAAQEETILLSGPSGTGKSRLAEWCHAHSPRRGGPFQVVDLLSVPEELQMAELLGWRRGAFTGALHDQDGCIARGDGGSVFIDEVDKLSLKAQAGLLHLLETRRYRVLGDTGVLRPANVRFILATNASLKAEVAKGRFREDLYFRINVLPFRVLPLSARIDEIVSWARYMLAQRCKGTDAGDARLTAEAEGALAAASWPGNLRQLENVVRRAYALALAAQGVGRPGTCVELSHVEQALAFEDDEVAPLLMESLRRAASDFIEHARTCSVEGRKLDIDDANVLRGLVLEMGMRRFGDLRKVFLLLGGEAAVRNRNYNREYRREIRKVARLEERLARAPQAALRRQRREPRA